MCINASLLFYGWMIPWYGYITFSSLVDETYGLFLITINNAAVNIHVHVFVWKHVFSSLGNITSHKAHFSLSFLAHKLKTGPHRAALHCCMDRVNLKTFCCYQHLGPGISELWGQIGARRLKEGGPIYPNWDTWKSWKEKRIIMSSKLKDGRTMKSTCCSPESDTSAACTMSPSGAFQRPSG